MQSLFKIPTKIGKDELPDALQQAIEIEIATIPVYLYTYYSIIRQPNQLKIIEKIKNGLIEQKVSASDAQKKAENLSADIMVFANKAGSLIMSVVIEEMLHMALSSNVKQALVGMPELVNKSPQGWPVALPGHEPQFPINLAKFSDEQLVTFLKIESPKAFTNEDVKLRKIIDYTTIGEFYCLIENCIRKYYPDEKDYRKDAPQLIPMRGYYTNNTIDTVYYDKKHKPQFPDSRDSGDLIQVVDLCTALAAIQEIVEQGEGHQGGNRLTPDGKPICSPSWEDHKINPEDYDDPEKKELSHFDKFLELYCENKRLSAELQKLKIKGLDLDSIMVRNVPLNPLTINYPSDIQAVSNLTNAIYSYIFIMTEECYRKEGNTQYEIFMFGIHKSMIWLLSQLCSAMADMTYTDVNGNVCNVGTTFENYMFDKFSSPKTQIIQLCKNATIAMPSMSWVLPIVEALPDVDVDFAKEMHNMMAAKH